MRSLVLGSLFAAIGVATIACKSADGSAKTDAGVTPVVVREAGGDDDEDPVEVRVPDAAPEATAPRAGDYFVSCLTELTNEPQKVFSFWATATTTGGTLDVTLEALRLVGGHPPTTVTRAGITGGKLAPIGGMLEADGGFNASIGASQKVTFPGDSNPISGSDVVLANPGLAGVYKADGFCARLAGRVEAPEAAARDLDPTKNFCIFVPITDGAPAPAFAASNYTVEKCPL